MNAVKEQAEKQKRKPGLIRDPEVKQCKICGKLFLKTCSMKQTCSPECSHQNMLNNQRRKRLEYYGDMKEVTLAKERMYYHKNTKSRCKICGELMQRDPSGERLHSKPQMHESCILHDCAVTLAKGENLSKKQFLRLQSRGWTLTEFREEYAQYV